MLPDTRFVVDTNILIDYLAKREPFYPKAELLMALGYMNEFELWIGTSQITDLIYVMSDGGKSSLTSYVQESMLKLKKILHIYATDSEDYDNVARCAFSDLEDAFIFQTAIKVKANAIISRDKEGFSCSSIKVLDCDELFEYLESTKGVAYADITDMLY